LRPGENNSARLQSLLAECNKQRKNVALADRSRLKMNLRAERKNLVILLSINVFVILVQFLIFIAIDSWGTRGLMRALVIALVYANVTAVPAILILPRLLERISHRRSLLLPAVILGQLFFILVGCLAAQTLLMWTGIFTAPFLLWYERILPLALLGALLFGAGAYIYGSMQERLHKTEERLHEKEVLEERTQKLAAEARLESLKSRLHPHFLFNTLNSISSLIADDPALAENMVGRLAKLLRSTLDNSNQPLIALRQELAMIRDYFEIEKIRFGEKLAGRIDVPEQLQEAKVPPLSVLSLVENAVKHGITPQSKGGEVLVVASNREQGGRLLIEVRDSGPGFSLSSIPSGHGLDNLVTRLGALFGENARMNVLQRDGWCIVQMVVPQS
jgi:sensor histidine kinase YesM